MVHDFIFLTGGHTTRSKGLDDFAISSNTFFFLPAYQITIHECMSLNANGLYCHFDLEMLSTGFTQRGFINAIPFLQFASYPVFQIPAALQTVVLPILERLEAKYQAEAPDKLDVIRACLLTLFVELMRSITPIEPRTNAAGQMMTLYIRCLKLAQLPEAERVGLCRAPGGFAQRLVLNKLAAH